MDRQSVGRDYFIAFYMKFYIMRCHQTHLSVLIYYVSIVGSTTQKMTIDTLGLKATIERGGVLFEEMLEYPSRGSSTVSGEVEQKDEAFPLHSRLQVEAD